jgi:hypothetical protein
MKKLLATTALAGVVLSGSAFAQTTITGELRLGYKAMSHSTPATSSRGFGTEQQINVQTKGKTNIGWDYAAGFSLENDGEQATTLYNENVYMDFINPGSGTMITIGRDHIQRSDSARNASVFFGYDASDVIEGVYSATTTQLIQASPGAAIGQSYGIGIVQDVAKIGKLSYNFVPSTSAAADSEGTPRDNSTGGYEVGFTGNLGVAGLNTYAFKQSTSSPVTGSTGQNTVKAEVKNFGASYSVGQISAGYERTVHQGKSTTLGNREITENGYGVAYAITKDLSIQGHLTKAKQDGAAAESEVKSIQLGYNLGPVALVVGYGEGENVNGTAGIANQVDGVGFVRLLGAF